MDFEYIEHVTVEGERWDQIADRYYGAPLGYEAIVRANPAVAITTLLPSGLVLRIPLLRDEDVELLLEEDLPPWKRPVEG